MEQIGIIEKVLETREGVSKTTGNPWKITTYLLVWEDNNYKKHLPFEVSGADTINRLNIEEGKQYKVFFNLDAREYNGRWYPSIRAWDARQYDDAVPSKPQETPKEDSSTTKAPTEIKAAEPKAEAKKDDLPF